MSRTWRWRFGAVAAATLLAVGIGSTACKKKPEGEAGAPPAAATKAPAPSGLDYMDERDPSAKKDDGGWLIHTLEGDCRTLNPVLSASQYEAMVFKYIYRNVIEYDRELNFVPALAESWEISPDHKTYTFRLAKNATWEDGKPVTARDFDFTVHAILDPNVPAINKQGAFASYASSRVVDDHTYEITFKEASASQLYAFVMPIIPEHVYGYEGEPWVSAKAKGTKPAWKGKFVDNPANRKPVGNGPYEFVRWETNKLIELDRRDDYWGEKPALAKILLKVIPDEAVRLQALETGEVDEARLSSIQWKGVKDDPKFNQKNRTLMFQLLATPNFIAWNNHSPLFDDKRVRQAMSELIDRNQIIQSLYFGTAYPASGPFPYGSWARNPNVAPWPYDPPDARKKLAAAGWTDSNGDGKLDKDGRDFSFELQIPAGNPISEQLGALLQRELERIGGHMEIRQVEFAVMNQNLSTGQYEAATQALTTDPDPDFTALFHSKAEPPNGFNFFYYENPEADKLLEQGQVEFDHQKRQQLYWKLCEILHEDEPASWVLYPSMKWGLSKRFKNVSTSPLGLFAHEPGSLDWWVPKADQVH